MCHNPLNRIKCRVVHNKEIAEGIYDMSIDVGHMVDLVKPGQFVNLYVKGGVHLLPRPISICGLNKQEKTIRLVYALVGQGTKILTSRQKRDAIEVLGPLGNGFDLDFPKVDSVNKVLIVGGGVGTPPLLELARTLKEHYGDSLTIISVLGFRDETYLTDEFKAYGQVYIATDSGKVGFKGNVIQLMENELARTVDLSSFNMMYSCGPTPMLKALQGFNNKYGLEGQLSLEERMGCGFGACVGCVVAIRREISKASLKLTKETINDQDYDYKKVCKDGPVFNWKEVVL